MEDIYKDNFLEAVKGAEKSIFSSCLISIVLFGLAFLKKVEVVHLPIIGLDIEGSAGIAILLILYAAIGFQLCMYLHRAKKNLQAIKDQGMRKALMLFPSFACGSLSTRIFSSIFPSLLFLIAMNKGFEGNLAIICFMTGAFSTPYIFAMILSYETKS